MGTQYWLQRGDHVLGPYSASQLRQMASISKFSPEDLISQDQKRWVKAARVRGLLFPSPTTTQNELYQRTLRKKCYLRQANIVSGPYSPSQMKNLLAEGKIAVEDEISKDGQHWKKVDTFKGLQSHGVFTSQEQPRTPSEPTVYFEKEIPVERRVSKRFFRRVTQEAKMTIRIVLVPRTEWTFSSEGTNAPIVLSDPLDEKTKQVNFVADGIYVRVADRFEKFLLSDEACESLRKATQQQCCSISTPGVCFEKVIDVQRCVSMKRPKRIVRQEAKLTIRVLGLPKTEWTFSSKEMEAPIVLLDPFSKNSKTLEGADFHGDTVTVLSSRRAERFRLADDAWELLKETIRKQQDCGGTSGPAVYSEQEFHVDRCVSEGFIKRVTEEAKLKIITLRPLKTYWRFSSEMDDPISFWDHQKIYEQMRFAKGAITVSTPHGDEKFLLSEQASESLGQILQEHVDIAQAESEDPCPKCGEQSMISGACLSCGHVRWLWMSIKTMLHLLVLLFCTTGIVVAATDIRMEGSYFMLFGCAVGFLKFSKSLGETVLVPIMRAKSTRKPDEHWNGKLSYLLPQWGLGVCIIVGVVAQIFGVRWGLTGPTVLSVIFGDILLGGTILAGFVWSIISISKGKTKEALWGFFWQAAAIVLIIAANILLAEN